MSLELMRQAEVAQAWLPWLGALLALVLVCATAEGLVQTFVRRLPYDWRAYAASMADAVGRRVVDALGLSIALPVLAFAHAHRVHTLELSTPAAVALLFVGQEFCYYWYHRAAHRVRWFWATHAVHHSPNELTLAAALRLGWTGKLTGTTLFFTPLVWLGFSPLAVMATLAANLLYQFWLHAPWMPRLGPLEWVLNTPTHHKVHHASNPEYLDCNYGGVLIVFDRLFGTFVDLRADVVPRYGLTTPLYSHNPVRIALHEWGKLARDLWATRGWKARLATVFGPPGGRP
ncbi:sterol desaturase family protein [Pseudorhodoferax sp. LjRoot39]|uniref:sterol desaturase family protein n=1 Tax=Pseudorhodoferax sp. LjRoot39 TaxID=3342328 RepID=UPI003ECE5872